MQICPAYMEIFLLSPVALHVNPLPYIRPFILHGHIVLSHPTSCELATQRLRLYDTPTGSDKNGICQVQYSPWSISMFGDSDTEALTSGVRKCLVSNVKREDISARYYTGLMSKSLCEFTNTRCEPFEVTFSEKKERKKKR